MHHALGVDEDEGIGEGVEGSQESCIIEQVCIDIVVAVWRHEMIEVAVAGNRLSVQDHLLQSFQLSAGILVPFILHRPDLVESRP